MRKAKWYRRGIEGYKKGRYQIDPPPQMFAEWILIDEARFDGYSDRWGADLRRAAHRHNKMIMWAANKPPNQLVDAIGRLSWELSLAKSRMKETSVMVDKFRGRAISSKKTLEEKRNKHVNAGLQTARTKGTRAWRDAANGLWPKADKYGWSAERFTKSLNQLGHPVKQGTVAKWMPTLRRGGTL